MRREIKALNSVKGAAGTVKNSRRLLHETIESIIGERIDETNTSAVEYGIAQSVSNQNGIERISKIVAELYNLSGNLADAVYKTVEDECTSIDLEKQEKDRNAKWERNNKWEMWAHSTLRWILGAILVVLMFSTAVWISKHCSFIKVPVHEWIHPSKDENELHW